MIDHPLMLFVAFPLAAYVIGSTPFAFLIARAKGIDLRKVGSGNVGATNCGRACGRGWGYLCFFLDVAKGLAPVLVAGMLIRHGGSAGSSPAGGAQMRWTPTVIQQTAWLLTGCLAIAGHIFTFWLRFRGGKGVATALGVVLGIWPYFTLAGLIALAVWIVVTMTSRYVSLGSIVAAAGFLPAFALLNWPPTTLWPMAAFAGAMVAMIIFRHRANISRLLAGTENKIGSGKKDRPQSG